uniref:Uncharacterized protein n=1 Tax=Sphaerodactylus townsendi TaxID=933632 RepID=A0ACB8FEX8_9SAUR
MKGYICTALPIPLPRKKMKENYRTGRENIFCLLNTFMMLPQDASYMPHYEPKLNSCNGKGDGAGGEMHHSSSFIIRRWVPTASQSSWAQGTSHRLEKTVMVSQPSFLYSRPSSCVL